MKFDCGHGFDEGHKFSEIIRKDGKFYCRYCKTNVKLTCTDGRICEDYSETKFHQNLRKEWFKSCTIGKCHICNDILRQHNEFDVLNNMSHIKRLNILNKNKFSRKKQPTAYR